MNIIGKRLQGKNLKSLLSTVVRSTSTTQETFMTGNSIGYIEQMHEAWKKDPNSVHVSWNAYFTNLAQGISPAFVVPPTLGSGAMPAGSMSAMPVGASVKSIDEHLRIMQLVQAYQLKGHEIADYDPLSIFI